MLSTRVVLGVILVVKLGCFRICGTRTHFKSGTSVTSNLDPQPTFWPPLSTFWPSFLTITQVTNGRFGLRGHAKTVFRNWAVMNSYNRAHTATRHLSSVRYLIQPNFQMKFTSLGEMWTNGHNMGHLLDPHFEELTYGSLVNRPWPCLYQTKLDQRFAV